MSSRAEMYAAKYVNESHAYPTDEAISTACSGCVRKPRPEELAAIREAILRLYPRRTWTFRRGERVEVVGAADYNGSTGTVAWVEDGRVGVWIEGGDLTTFLASEVVDAEDTAA